LPNRVNIVLSRELEGAEFSLTELSSSTKLLIVKERETALFFADLFTIANRNQDFFVVGGAEVYKSFIDLDIVHRVYLTDVFCSIKGDAFYKEKFDSKKWKTISEFDKIADDADEYGYRFTILERKKRKNRYRFRETFFTDQKVKNDWLARYIKTNRQLIEQNDLDFSSQYKEQYSFNF